MPLRARFVALAALLLGLLAGCGAPEHAPPDAGREMKRARRYAAALVRESARAPEVGAEEAVALGYLERLRLGLGSPFRLIEHALLDPRLPEETRARLAWALLARTLQGEAYQVDPAALEMIRWGGDPLSPHHGPYHLERIAEAVEEGSDPRTGEMVVRMAYALSAAEGSVGPAAPTVAAWAAALLRDRQLAREDARDLLRAAEEAGLSPLALLAAWRSARRFRVEAPLLPAPGHEAEREAARGVLLLTARLRPDTHEPHASRAPEGRGTLPPRAAARLAEEAARLDLPPRGEVIATLRAYRNYLFAGRVPADSADARLRLLREARDEERFAAEYARLRASGGGGPGPAAVALAVAVAARAQAQEAVWFPGFAAPTEHELRTRHGLASVSFDRSIPAAWRPYYLRALDASLYDLRRVFPTLALKGLRVRFGALRRDDALATHSPRSRTITLPPETGAGTLAHEIAHDLDLQAARLRYGSRSSYRTDRAVVRRGDRVAAALQELAPEPLDSAGPGEFSSLRRPTEVFARNVDWFVAASLARQGRTNGYLSSVQDRTLIGYASAAPPDPDGRAGSALVRILDEVAPVPAEDRRWFLERWGSGRPPSALAVVEGVLRTPLSEDGVPAAEPRRSPFGLSLAEPRTPCVGGGWEAVLGAAPHHRALEEMAVRARVRGLALAQAERLAGREGREWMARRLNARLWSPTPVDSATTELLQPLLRQVERLEETPGPWSGEARPGCAGEGARRAVRWVVEPTSSISAPVGARLRR
jgi:hypothetical protein